ncbi:MAG TPA: hypothetical protein VFV98_05215 [Vicinamibacterales bacterium]|nr:hypothetical protein [Vicinamibacterales bacterium]
MPEPAYPAARAVASAIEAHFGRHRAAATAAGRVDLAPPPDAASVETIVDAAFWASLRREEGITPKISLALTPPSKSQLPLLFSQSLPLYAAALAKLAPAVERPGIHLGVWPENGALRVWGTTRTLPPLCFVLEVIASGLLVIKHRGDSFGKFVNVAVLEGDQIKMIDESDAKEPECPNMVQSLLGFDRVNTSAVDGQVNVLVQMAASMRAHGRGGALLVVPSASTTWVESIVSPVLYEVTPPFTAIADALHERDTAPDSHEWQDDLRRAVDAVAGLTAVDGATVLRENYELVAFGAKITRRVQHPLVERVALTEPIVGSAMTVVSPTQLGGTRHLSAAQFVHDQRDAVALVASQDGRFTIFKWSMRENMVHAHRVEALLL